MGTRNPGDYLSLYMDPFVRKHIMPTEEILFSDLIIKTNRKGRPQDRVLLITSAAVYNLVSVPTGRALKRRIDIRLITKITVSNISNEFVIHVPSEYDYRISSSRKLEIIQIMVNTAARLSLHNTGLTSSKGSNILSTSYANGMTPRLIEVIATDAIDLGNVTRLRTGGGNNNNNSNHSASSSSSSASYAYLQSLSPSISASSASSSSSSASPFYLPNTMTMTPSMENYSKNFTSPYSNLPYVTGNNYNYYPTTNTINTTTNNSNNNTNGIHNNEDDDSDNENISFRSLPYPLPYNTITNNTSNGIISNTSTHTSSLYSPHHTTAPYRSPPPHIVTVSQGNQQPPNLHGSIFMNNLPLNKPNDNHHHYPHQQQHHNVVNPNPLVNQYNTLVYTKDTASQPVPQSSISHLTIHANTTASREPVDFDDNDENTSPWLHHNINGNPNVYTGNSTHYQRNNMYYNTNQSSSSSSNLSSPRLPVSSSSSSGTAPLPSSSFSSSTNVPPTSPQVTGWSKPESAVGLNDFELLRVIGRGSYGKVFLVRKTDTKEVLAMKVLHKAVVIARNQIEHTQAERAILESIDHPFLCHLRYAFQTKTKLYLVLPYLRGGEVFHHLKNQKRFSEPLAKFYIAEIVLGLGHLHAVGIVYRDLKPENILLDSDGHVCLTDFGLAKVLTQPTDTANTFCGTPEYLAPEVIEGFPHDKGVDWWSLGILLWEMLTGLPPFYHSNVQIMYEAIRKAELHFPALISPSAQSILRALLTKNPNDRLGNRSQDNDAEAVKMHPFFNGIDWVALYERRIPPPWKPVTVSSSDVSNFDREFTSEPVLDSVTNPVPGLRNNVNNNTNSTNTITKLPHKNDNLEDGEHLLSDPHGTHGICTPGDIDHHPQHHHSSGQDEHLHSALEGGGGGGGGGIKSTHLLSPSVVNISHPEGSVNPHHGDTNNQQTGEHPSNDPTHHHHPSSTGSAQSFHAPHFEGFSYAAQHSGALHGSPTAVSL